MSESNIIILTKNAGIRFEELLKRISNQTYQDFEVVVVDSGSKDNTLKIAEEYGCRIYENRRELFKIFLLMEG